MTQRLKDLDALEVAMVPKMANRKKFLILKSEEESGMLDEAILKAVLETDLEDEEKVNKVLKAAKLSEKGQNAVKGALRLLGAYKDELPKDVLKTLAELGGYGYPEPAQKQKDEEDKKKQEEEAKKVEEAKKQADKDKDKYTFPVKKADGTMDFSGVPEAVRPAIEALWKENEAITKRAIEAEKVAKEERDKRVLKEYVEKAAAELADLPGAKAEDLGAVLKGIEEKDPALYAKLYPVLKASSEAIAKGQLFAELGRGGGAPVAGSATEKVMQMVAGIVQKDAKATSAEAMGKVMAEHPELYEQYKKETVVKV